MQEFVISISPPRSGAYLAFQISIHFNTEYSIFAPGPNEMDPIPLELCYIKEKYK